MPGSHCLGETYRQQPPPSQGLGKAIASNQQIAAAEAREYHQQQLHHRSCRAGAIVTAHSVSFKKFSGPVASSAKQPCAEFKISKQLHRFATYLLEVYSTSLLVVLLKNPTNPLLLAHGSL